jgi:hypothetical protein
MKTPDSTLTFYTYRAQLTFGLSPSKEVNVAEHFSNWLNSSFSLLKAFLLLPYNSPSDGQQLTSPTEAATEDPTFFNTYFHNHRVLQHGNLTGMVHFQTSTPWTEIK